MGAIIVGSRGCIANKKRHLGRLIKAGGRELPAELGRIIARQDGSSLGREQPDRSLACCQSTAQRLGLQWRQILRWPAGWGRVVIIDNTLGIRTKPPRFDEAAHALAIRFEVIFHDDFRDE